MKCRCCDFTFANYGVSKFVCYVTEVVSIIVLVYDYIVVDSVRCWTIPQTVLLMLKVGTSVPHLTGTQPVSVIVFLPGF